MASVLVSNNSSARLRDPLVINYLFKSVFELVDHESSELFGMDDIALLVDAQYKSQMPLTDKYGDLFVKILEEQQLLNLPYLETQPALQTIRMLRGFVHLTEGSISKANQQKILSLTE